VTDLSIRGAAPRKGTIEVRNRPFAGAEIREAPDGSGGKLLRFTGYASVTEAPYEMGDMLGDYTEVIRRGAFAKTLGEGADVPFKVNHAGLTLARTKSGTMRLSEDSTGLHVEADLDPRAPSVLDLQVAMERGDVDEMSFGFQVTRQEWSPDWTQRDITEVNLNKGDVSAVNYGANPATAGASLRSREAAEVLRELRSGKELTPEKMDTILALVAALGGLPEAEPEQDEPALAERFHAYRLRLLDL
jgi:HK97 family phage prohead protease